jgi:cellulose synthase/poly-beta-1,6-N-acetylglucosamine synthase-like glycosyltransferase
MAWVILIVSFIYAYWVFKLRNAWHNIPIKFLDTGIELSSRFSIIVPMRNEESNIEKLLRDLLNQRYQNFEVLVMDDASTDRSREIVEKYVSNYPEKISLISLEENQSVSPKKRAIAEGINLSTGDIILTTDADCRVNEFWLQNLALEFTDEKVNMISGPVTFHSGESIFQNFQIIEFASLVGTGAASIYLKSPNMCNGANLAYRKSSYEKAGGFAGSEHIASGDDEFLMHKIFELDSQGVRFLKNPESVVRTNPPASMNEFVMQRRRWAGKWAQYKNKEASKLAFSIFLYHFLWIVTLVVFIFGEAQADLVLAAFVLRIFTNWLFLKDITDFLGHRIKFFNFLLLELIYSFYVVFFGLLANFGKYEWKGRVFRR